MEKIILDTDIGSDVDDAIALLYAIRNRNIDLRAVTTVYGHTGLRAKIARKIMDYSGLENIPVYKGEVYPIASAYKDIWHTGREGEGILSEDEFNCTSESMGIKPNAVDFLVNEITNNPKQYSLVCIGPLTNIARAMEKEPKVAECLKNLYIMGGDFSFSDEFPITRCAYEHHPEHNILCDVKAARIVFNSGTDRTLVPIDVTKKTGISRQDFEFLKRGDKADRAVANLINVWFDYRTKLYGKRVEYTCMHDPLTLIATTEPNVIETRRMPVSIGNDGITYVSGDNYTNVAGKIDEDRFRKRFFEVLRGRI
jgi:purine nucleosidase